jgi:hypothetical protein
MVVRPRPKATAAEVALVEALAAAIGMAGPVVLAAALGDLPLGLAAAVGSLMVGGIGGSASAKAQARRLVAALAPAALAALAAILAAGHDGLTNAVLVLLAGAAAAIGGYSRPAAAMTTRFVLFLIITINVVDVAPARAALLLPIAAGAAWTASLSLLLGSLLRACRRIDPADDEVAPASTPAQRRARWRRSLAQLSGWEYPLRLVLCLGIAGGLQSLWPDHHLYWIALTVAILARRRVEAFPTKTLQRALGTALGVLAASLFLADRLPVWGLIIGIALLAGARPLLRSRNYLGYSAIMTLLIVAIMDSRQTFGAEVLIDRLVATIIGAGLVIAANVAFGKAINGRRGA